MPHRRLFLKSSTAVAAVLAAPGLIAADGDRPIGAQGLQLGDPADGHVTIWSRCDRPARMVVDWSLEERFTNPTRIIGPQALETNDFTARLDLAGLPPGREVFMRASFQALGNERAISEPILGRVRIPAAGRQPIRFLWGADTAGQGWGINPAFGGMRIYETMRNRRPDFFIHSGDTIYADGPIKATQATHASEGGAAWSNLVTPEVAKVAETLDEFRGRYRYNLLDANVRRFNAEVPQIWQWDDHEVTNNWSDGKSLEADARYQEKSVPLLTIRGARAFIEYSPMRLGAPESQRVYRRIPHGPLLDLFVLDMRAYRGANNFNRQSEPGPQTAFLGDEQLQWLKRGLAESRAVWKIVAADMPIGLVVGDGKDAEGRDRFESVANGDGAVAGREFEFADLFSFLKRQRVQNVVWLTGDVHYAAAHFYDPKRAVFADFDPFWEFVAGPLNAGSFPPNKLDNTFGPQIAFMKASPPGMFNLSPLAGLQFFGEVNIDAQGHLTVDLRDIGGQSVYSRALTPA
jgi:alkaline phosphatase D